ncbi:MAG: hydrogenase nickel incorporation protein HypA [Candidatus Bathyarchaeia archaeon]
MHEWALAEAIITTAARIAEKEKLSNVTEVTISIGELQQVEVDILKFAFSQLKPDSFKNTKFRVTREKTVIRCRVCGNTWHFKDQKMNSVTVEAIHFVPEVAHTYVKCPRCGSPDFEITEGRGIWLKNVKGTR